MARRQVTMNEIVEMIFQWHQEASLKQIRRSLGFQRNTVRKYIRFAQAAGVSRGKPLPERSELAGRLKALQDKGPSAKPLCKPSQNEAVSINTASPKMTTERSVLLQEIQDDLIEELRILPVRIMPSVGYNYWSWDIRLALPHGGHHIAVKLRVLLAIHN